MSNKRITDLTELTTPTTDDVFPVVDIATNTTTKVQLANLPVQTAVTTALATKQATLVSGTNIKTVNSTTLLGSGDVAVQPTLVSGTNIKTLNSVSLLGSGDIVLAATPSGVAGAIQFSNGSAFASDATNFFWDNTNKRLGVGTNVPTATGHFKGSGSTSATTSLLVQNSAGTAALTIKDDLSATLGGTATATTFTGTGYFSLISELRLVIGTAPNRTLLRPVGDGILTILNAAEADFNRLQLGGTTASFPSIKRASNNIEIKNADDTFGAGLSVGAALNASAILQADSTTKGFLPPRMTTTQKNAIASPAAGLVVYDSTTNKLCCYNGSTWNDLF
jgi:hypothetical protein